MLVVHLNKFIVINIFLASGIRRGACLSYTMIVLIDRLKPKPMSIGCPLVDVGFMHY